ncbi:hypothetical protein ABTK59_20160, partial [Acinetobacter baumannii]
RGSTTSSTTTASATSQSKAGVLHRLIIDQSSCFAGMTGILEFAACSDRPGGLEGPLDAAERHRPIAVIIFTSSP